MEAVNNQSPSKHKMLIQPQTGYQGSDSQCEIPLREPLDPEYRLNRKLAKQIYNKERVDRVNNNKEAAELKKQEDFLLEAKKQKKIDKKKEEESRNKAKDFRDKIFGN